MNFTEKEILFAKQLKEMELKWKPAEGDWFCDNNDIVSLCCIVDAYYIETIDGRGYNCHDVTWLPTLQQSIDILKCYNIGPVLYIEKKQIVIPGKEAYVGETILEAIYKLLLVIEEQNMPDLAKKKGGVKMDSGKVSEERRGFLTLCDDIISHLDEGHDIIRNIVGAGDEEIKDASEGANTAEVLNIKLQHALARAISLVAQIQQVDNKFK